MPDALLRPAFPEVDDATVDRMTDEFVVGEAIPTAVRIFTERGAPSPIVQWSPPADALALDGHRLVLGLWERHRAGAAYPPAEAIDPFELKPALGNIMVVEVVDRGADFRFRIYGSLLAEAARCDWTGSSIQEMRRIMKSAGPPFYLASYRAMLRRPEALYTVNPGMVVFRSRAWGRIALPYGDAATGRIERILVANYVVSNDHVSEAEERRLAKLREHIRIARRLEKQP